VLLAYIAEALNAIEPLDERVFAALASPVSSVPGSVVPRLGSAFSSMTSPVVLVLDDEHVLRNSECRAALAVLADHVPAGSRFVLAGRAERPLRIARLRAEGRLLEIGPGDLPLSLSEAESLLRGAGLVLSEEEVAALHQRTEGWPAALLSEQACSALRLTGREESYPTPLVCAVQARVDLHLGNVSAARQEMVSAQRLRPLLTYATPHLAIQARIELVRVHLALGDLAAARTLMHEVDDLLRRRPGLGTLVDEAQALRAPLSSERGPAALGASALTAAELRLLPMLSTHLSVPEIAAELFLSRNTIRSQAMSVYRKLGVSSRSAAVARSRELGLLDG
jgi:ATP/maltotriose-dependent transcriptional regulator MalT